MSIARYYTKALYQELTYFGTWLPQATIQLGDVGIINNGVFERGSSLQQLGITFLPAPGETRRDDAFTYRTHGGVAISVGGQLDTAIPNLPNGNINITFSKEQAILFDSKGVQIFGIEDLFELTQKIEAKYKEGTWKKNWKVITEVVKVESATILIAKGQHASIELKANTPGLAENINLADADVAIVKENGLHTKIIASSSLIPLYRMKGIKWSLIGGSQFRGQNPEQDVQQTLMDTFDDITPEDLDIESGLEP